MEEVWARNSRMRKRKVRGEGKIESREIREEGEESGG